MTVVLGAPTSADGGFGDVPLSGPWGDPALAVGEDAEAGLVDWFAAECHVAWRKACWVWAAARSRSGTLARRDEPDARVVAAALGWTVSMAWARIEFAHGVLVRLPALGEEMREGRLEEGKAAKFVTLLRELDDEAARQVVERLLGRAPDLGFAELGERIERSAAAIDPDWWEARRAAAVARARVVARTAPSGAAELSAADVEHELAVPAHERVVALGALVLREVTARGGETTVGRAEARVFLRLLRGGPEGSDDHAVIAAVADELCPPDPPPGDGHDPDGPAGPGPDEPGPDGPGPDGHGPDESGPDDPGPDEPVPDGYGPDEPGPDEPGPDETGPDGHGPDESGPDDPGPERPGADDADPDGARTDDVGPGDTGTDHPAGRGDHTDTSMAGGVTASSAAAAATGGGVTLPPTIALRCFLTTVLGLDRRPGTRPGWGTLAPRTVRALAWSRTAAQFRLLLYDDEGALVHALLVRPPPGPEPDPRHQRQVVELTATVAEVDALDPARLVGDFAELARRARAALVSARARASGDHPVRSLADAGKRFAGADLARWLRARDRTCRFPMCTRPAVLCDLDHTLEYALGGITVSWNLGCTCPGDHARRHRADSGWTVTQPESGTFVWTAPTGTRHTVRPERYDPLPDPLPRHGDLDPGEELPPRPREPWAARPDRWGRITDAARDAVTRLRRAAAGHVSAPGSGPGVGAAEAGAAERADEEPPF